MPNRLLTATLLALLALLASAAPASASPSPVITDASGDARGSLCLGALGDCHMPAGESQDAADILETTISEASGNLVIETTYLDVDKPVTSLGLSGRIDDKLTIFFGTSDTWLLGHRGHVELEAGRDLNGAFVPGTAKGRVSGLGGEHELSIDVSVDQATERVRWSVSRADFLSAAQEACPECTATESRSLTGFVAKSAASVWAVPDPVQGFRVRVFTVAEDWASGLAGNPTQQPSYTIS